MNIETTGSFNDGEYKHRRTIRTVRGIVTCDPIHLLYFVTPAHGLIQVIGRNAS